MKYEWECEYCGSFNDGKQCTQCGAPKRLHRLVYDYMMSTAARPAFGPLLIDHAGIGWAER